MKKLIYLIAVLPLLLANACAKEDTSTENVQPIISKRVALNVGVDGLGDSNLTTKASSASANETTVASLQIFVFKTDGSLDAYGTGTSSSLSLSVTTGTRDIYAIVNAPSLNTIRTKSALLDATSNLTDNLTNFVMTGAKLAQPISAASSISIAVSRLVARLAISKITNKMASVQYQSDAFVVTKIYVINVAGANNYGVTSLGSTWYNQMKYVSGAADAILYDAVTSGTIAYNASLSSAHYFYVYPNSTATDTQSTTWGPRFTRLVVEATLGGKTYYYPISIPSIQQNKTYTVSELTITRPGSDSPDIPVSSATCTFSVTVTDWAAASGTGTGAISI